MVNFIQLREGPIVRADALLLALSLEQAGHTLTERGEAMEVAPKVPEGPLRAALQDAHVRRHLKSFMLYAQHAPRPL